ncbi:hypothetical protein EAE96_009290 [Botrytis aclada]|nr:hypothetical protein EAE96_009290 [Botrytis aclada]
MMGGYLFWAFDHQHCHSIQQDHPLFILAIYFTYNPFQYNINFSSRIRTTPNAFTMSTKIPNDWFLVKLTRWEDGHETSSALLPVNISAGDTSYGLRNGLEAVSKRIWDYFTVIEKDGNSSDRTNLPLGATLRQADGIEGLSVDWPSQRTVVTDFSLPGIRGRLSMNNNAVIHCTVKDSRLDGIAWCTPKN